MEDRRVEIAKNGIMALSLMAKVAPVDPSDNIFVQAYKSKTSSYENKPPLLQTPSHGAVHRRLRDLFGKENGGADDLLIVAKEVKELEARE